MMLGAVLCFTLLGHARLAAARSPSSLALAACALWGVVVERVAVRPVRGARLEFLADRDRRARHRPRERRCCSPSARTRAACRPAPHHRHRCTSPASRVHSLQLLIPVVGLALALACISSFSARAHGKALLAVVQNTDAARLMGIDVERVVDAGVRAVRPARRRRRHPGRAAVHDLLHHGHAVRHQGFRGRDPRRHRQRLGRGAGRAHLRPRRGADHRAARLDLHADRHLRARHPRAGGAAERPVRPRRGDARYERARALLAAARWRSSARRASASRAATTTSSIVIAPGRAHRDRRHRPQRAARARRPDLARPRRLLRHRRLRRRHPDDQARDWLLAGAAACGACSPAVAGGCSPCRRCACAGPTSPW